MILAEKIMEERKRNGWSQEELADQLAVSRQSVSKWESAQSVPDLQRVVQMAKLFGVSTDYLLKDDYEPQTSENDRPVVEEYTKLRQVSMEEAHGFLSYRAKWAPIIAAAVAVCILSPVVLMILCGLAELGVSGITENIAAGVGVITLLAMVAVAVFVFITGGVRGEEFSFMEKEAFETGYGVSGMVRERKKDYEGTYTRGLALGVTLCILSCVPLLVAGCMDASDGVCVIMVAVLLAMVAAGVFLIVNVVMVRGGYDMLLQEGEYRVAKKQESQKNEHISSIYWCLITAIYLAWSFITRDWDKTWIIWPVAGVLYGAIAAIAACIREGSADR